MFLRSFVRRKRPLSKNKQLLLNELLPQFKVNLEELPKLLANYNIVNLEIGFGKGDFLTTLSRTDPENTINIGCDPYIGGVVSLLQKIKEHNIKNIIIWSDDVLLLLVKLADYSIDNIYILFPDPWSKRRQKKRRLINTQFIKLLIKKLKLRGTVFVATDHHDYADSIYTNFKHSKNFTCEDISKTSVEFFKNSITKYHQKNIEGKEIKLFKFSLALPSEIT